jgi:hypothetical protein
MAFLMSRDLYVILVHFNPRRLKVRTRLFKERVKALKKQGAKVIRVEVGYADNPFEVTYWWDRAHVRVRTDEELWNKEAAVNRGAQRVFTLNPRARYLAWIDADIEYVRPDWVAATIDQLQTHPVVQLFSNSIDLTPKYDFMGRAHGFARLFNEGQRPGDFEKQKNKYPSHMHPGYGWAFRTDAWAALGGMPTFAILGSGDHIMACGLTGFSKECIWSGLSEGYGQAISDWGDQAYRVVQGDIGYVEGLVLHHFHGYKEHRGYQNRIDILRQHQFDPSADLTYDNDGMPHLVGKPRLKAAISRYMSSRKEYDLTTALDQPLSRPWWKFW